MGGCVEGSEGWEGVWRGVRGGRVWGERGVGGCVEGSEGWEGVWGE